MSAFRRVAGGRAGSTDRRIYRATDLDEDVIKALEASDVPLSAYDLAVRLQNEGRRIFVVSIYRSLARLCAAHAAERVEMTSRYRIRDVPNALLTTCDKCGRTFALAADRQFEQLGIVIADSGFRAIKVALEAVGICRDCQEAGDRNSEAEIRP